MLIDPFMKEEVTWKILPFIAVEKRGHLVWGDKGKEEKIDLVSSNMTRED